MSTRSWKQFGYTWDYMERREDPATKALATTKRAFIVGLRDRYFGEVYRQYPLDNVCFIDYDNLEELKKIIETTVELLE